MKPLSPTPYQPTKRHMVAQPGKEEAKKHLKFVESEDEDRASDNDSSS